jgi:hypothetical protein
VPEDIETASGQRLGARLFKKATDINLHPAADGVADALSVSLAEGM